MKKSFVVTFSSRLVLLASGLFLLTGCENKQPEQANPEKAQMKTTVTEAYVYGYPLMVMDVTRQRLTNVPHTTNIGMAPINQFGSKKTVPDETFTDVVSANADTLYSSAFLDLSKEPVVLSIPAVGKRYYMMPMLDAWTNVFDSPGTRTTGNGKGDFVITGPNWSGSLPPRVKQIKSPTDMVWIIGRTATSGKADYAAVNAIQDKYKLTPLSAWGKPYTSPTSVPTDATFNMKTPPVEVVANMDAAAFFSRLAMLMKDNPPAPADAPMLAKLASIGVIPGQPFDLNKNGANAAKAISDGVNEGKAKVIDLGHNPGNGRKVNGWDVAIQGMGSYGTNYDARAGVTWFGLGANLPADAVYPKTDVDADGNPLNGANKYVLHFDKGQVPPVSGFWSLTMYNAKQAFVGNPIHRYAIGDRDKLKFNPDGSLDVFIEHDSPGAEKESNWLPADSGNFNLVLRLYWPKETILDGTWTPPAVKKAS
jgi:hypothetical protein